jgi:hypothetical protein
MLPVGRPRRRWENNIKKDLKQIRWEGWTGFKWLRKWRELTNMVME